MNAIKTNTTNVTFVADGCGDLPATRFKYTDGVPGIETCWELTPDELETVKKTGKIYLYVIGETTPPVMITAETQLTPAPLKYCPRCNGNGYLRDEMKLCSDCDGSGRIPDIVEN